MKLYSILIATLIGHSIFGQSEETKVEHSTVMEVVISPNPATDKCLIQGSEGAVCTVYSASGTYIGKWEFDQSNTVLLTDLPVGVYQAVIEKKGSRVVKRIVII